MKKLSLLLLVCMVSMLAFAQTEPDDNELPPGMVALSPTNWNFGQVPLDYPGEAIFTLNNNSANEITIYSIVATDPPFSVIPASGPTYCSTFLKSQSSCKIKVQFLPRTTGLKLGTLTVTDSANDSPQTAKLTGSGIHDVTLTPATCNFPDTFVFHTSLCPITLTNNMPVTLHISSVQAAPNPPFSAGNGCGKSVLAYQSCSITGIFMPDQLGEVTGTLTVTDDSNDQNGQQSVNLHGDGVWCDPKILPAAKLMSTGNHLLGAIGPRLAREENREPGAAFRKKDRALRCGRMNLWCLSFRILTIRLVGVGTGFSAVQRVAGQSLDSLQAFEKAKVTEGMTTGRVYLGCDGTRFANTLVVSSKQWA